MHAYAVEGLLPLLKPGANVLDIGSSSPHLELVKLIPSDRFAGCGSGYLLAVFHHLVSPGGTVLGIDHLQGLIDLSRTNLARAPRTLAALNSSSPSIQLYCEDGRKGSPPELTPAGGWDAIHVGAAAPHLPEELVAQLASPGRMFVPVGTGSQAIWQVDKNEAGEIHRQRLFGVNYIPVRPSRLVSRCRVR